MEEPEPPTAKSPVPASHREKIIERRSSKSRLSKQDEVEVVEEEDNSPESEASDATIVPAAGGETPVVHTPGDSPESNSPEENSSKLEPQRSVDSDKNSPTQAANIKVKLLVRSQAVCDDASPPPEDGSNGNGAHAAATTPLVTLSVSPTLPRGRYKLGKDNSHGSQGSTISDNGTSPALSRDSSIEYTDSTGIDLEEFIKMTLNKNRNDRNMLLKLESDMVTYIKESKSGDFVGQYQQGEIKWQTGSQQPYLKFPQMTSYHRMLVHRVAAFFGLDHNVDGSGKCVIVNTTGNTRVPDFKFRDYIRDEMSQEDLPKKQILKRDKETGSLDDGRSFDSLSLDGKKSKSFEEREEDYHKARERIFNQEVSMSQSSQEVMLESPSRPSTRSSRGSSKEDIRWATGTELRPWSSTDSSGYSTDSSAKNKIAVTKASSFHGVTVLNRGDSRTSSNSGRLSKTDSLSSGTSSLSSPMTRPPPIPSSPPPESQLSESGSSSQSATSPSQAHSHSADGQSPVPPIPMVTNEQGQSMAIWVASSLDSIPAGSIIINPQTAQPHLNQDGSPYRWPPPMTRQSAPHVAPQGPSHPAVAQQIPQPTLMVPPQGPQQQGYSPNCPTQETNSSEMSQQMSSMTITPQSSTESMGEAPLGGQQGQHIYLSPAQPAGLPHQVSPPQQPQQGYIPSQQVPSYYGPNQTTATQQFRYMYPTMPYQAGQGQGVGPLEVPSQPTQTQAGLSQGQVPQNGQYSGQQQPFVQNYGYQMMGFPQNMTVQSVETYQQQGYQAAGVNYQAGNGPEAAPQQQTAYTQFQPTTSVNQGSYLQQAPSSLPMFYSTPAAQNGSQGVTYPVTACQVSVSTQSPYRARTPPSQALGMAPSGLTGPAPVSITGSQPAPSNTQYVYTYPQQQGHTGTVQTPRMQTPQMVPYPSIPAQPGPPQPGYNIVRPNMQISMQMQTRTTPPPGSTASTGMPLIHGMQVHYQMDSSLRGKEGYPTDMGGSGDPTGATQAQQGMITAQKNMPVPHIRTPVGGPLYRPVMPQVPEDMRLIGQPLQQMPRPLLTPLYTARPRVPNPTGQAASGKAGAKGRKTWKGAVSPQSSTESMESSDSYCSTTLEVFGLPQGLKRCDLEGYLDDLTKYGARIQVPALDERCAGKTNPAPLNDCTVLAIFESDVSTQKALGVNAAGKYKVRHVTKPYSSSGTHCENPS